MAIVLQRKLARLARLMGRVAGFTYFQEYADLTAIELLRMRYDTSRRTPSKLFRRKEALLNYSRPSIGNPYERTSMRRDPHPCMPCTILVPTSRKL
jgi:hypothetical protein